MDTIAVIFISKLRLRGGEVHPPPLSSPTHPHGYANSLFYYGQAKRGNLSVRIYIVCLYVVNFINKFACESIGLKKYKRMKNA